MGQLNITLVFFIVMTYFYIFGDQEQGSHNTAVLVDGIVPKGYRNYDTTTTTEATESSTEWTTETLSELPPVKLKNKQLSPCPEGYNVSVINDTTYCYYLAKGNTACPYTIPTKFKDVQLLYKPEFGMVLTSLQKYKDKYYAPFIWNEPTEHYKVIELNIMNFSESGNDCVVYDGHNYIAVSCKSSYSTMCIINTNMDERIKNPCSLLYKTTSNECVMGDFDWNTCYCSSYRAKHSNRNSFCGKLAEPVQKYQTGIIVQAFDDSLPCWFGLEYNHQKYIWSSTNLQTDYTVWSPDAVLAKDNKYGAVTSTGWTMDEDINKFSCAICEENANFVNSRALLFFNEDRNMLELYVGNLYQVYDGLVYCFCEFSHYTFEARSSQVWIKPWTSYPALYRCEFYQFPTMKFVTSNAVIAYNTATGYNNEFALEIQTMTKISFPILDSKTLYSLVLAGGILDLFPDPDIDIRFIKIINYDATTGNVVLLYHITTYTDPKSNSAKDDFGKITTELYKFTVSSHNVNIMGFRSARGCMESKVQIDRLILTFPETVVGSFATPKELCLQENYEPVIRRCSGDFLIGGTWEDVKGKCLPQLLISHLTNELYELLTAEVYGESLVNNIDAITYNLINNAKPVDIHYAAKIFDRITKQKNETIDQDVLISSINNVMAINRTVLNTSQIALNATDRILCSIDKFLYNRQEINVSFPYLKINRINSSNDMAGIMVINQSKLKDSLQSFSLVPLYKKNYTQDLIQKDYELAFIIPREVVPQDYYFISIFYNDHLFNPNVSSQKIVGSWVVNILIPDATKFLESDIEIYFRAANNNQSNECVHWRFGNNEMKVPISGQWSYDGQSTKLKNYIHMCRVNHTTHFAMLVTDSPSAYTSKIDEFFLDAITLFESFLSILGVIIILTTAFVFKQWRKNPSNKIVVNVAVCLLALIVLLFVSDNMNEGIGCICVGVLLHYTVLSKFMWMTIIAYSNYRRLVLGLHYHIENVILKYSVLAWGMPVIFTTCTLALSPQTYNKIKSDDLCYPKEWYLKLGVLLPLSLMLVLNVSVYIAIIIKITTSSSNLRKHTFAKSYSKQKSIMLMFFLMGLTWTFGVISAFSTDVLFYYLFSATATLHGFTMFIYYILDFTNTREMWKGKIMKMCYARKAKKSESRTNSTDVEFSSSQTYS